MFRPFSQPIRLTAWFLAMLALALTPCARLRAAEPAELEAQAFAAAEKSFQGRWYERADKEFGEFIQKHPNSARTGEALLKQAESRYWLNRYDAIISLLASRTNAVDPLADQFRYWVAEAHLGKGSYDEAAERFGSLARDFPQSKRRLESSFSEAFARFKRGDADRTIRLLTDTNGGFQQTAGVSTNDLFAIRGYLLLGDAYLSRKDYPSVKAALNLLNNRQISPEWEWQRQYLLATADAATQQTNAVLERVTNLIALAQAAASPRMQASSLYLKADLFARTRPEVAIETYEEAARIKGLQPDEARSAVLKGVDLQTTQGRLTNALARLDAYIAENPQDTSLDLMHLSAAELGLKLFYRLRDGGAPAPAGLDLTNVLNQAAAHSDKLLTLRTNSALAGKAWLNRGWCYWEAAQMGPNPARLLESRNAFQTAVTKLERSEDQASALFKLADCQFQLNDFAGAVTNYQAVIDGYADNAEIKARLLDQAYYQMARAAVVMGKLDLAGTAVDKLVAQFPKSPVAERALFFLAESLVSLDQIGPARGRFAEFLKKFPSSTLAPEVELAAARVNVKGRDWPAAATAFDRWVAKYTNSPARPQAEFDRAWVYSKLEAAGTTNALPLFTNFVASFPTNALAPLALFWIGDHYYERQDFINAERNYQLLFQSTNAPSADLPFEAKLMAAKSAVLRQGFGDARRYLIDLIRSASCPTNVLAEAYFVMGDLFLEEPLSPGYTNVAQKFGDAISLYFGKIEKLFPDNRLVPAAQGRVGNCYYQLAALESAKPDAKLALEKYDESIKAFQQVIASPIADVATRSQAQVGLAQSMEKKALLLQPGEQKQMLNQALQQCLDVVFGNGLRPALNEQPDPFWVKEAGLLAGKLAEQLDMRVQAIGLYESLIKTLPAFRPLFEKKLEALRLQAAGPG